nr:OSIGBa0132E09-OSIGBa0108L24.13 [Oryza sativa]
MKGLMTQSSGGGQPAACIRRNQHMPCSSWAKRFSESAELVWKTWAPGAGQIITFANSVFRNLEIVRHLFMECPFTQQVWRDIGRKIRLSRFLNMTIDDTLLNWWREQTDEAEKLQQKRLRSVFLATLWEIWIERNNCIFRGTKSTPPALASKIIDELHLWEMAGAKGVQCIMLRE